MTSWTLTAKIAETAGSVAAVLPLGVKRRLARMFVWGRWPDKINVINYIFFNKVFSNLIRDLWLTRQDWRYGNQDVNFTMRLNLRDYVDRRYYFLNEDAGLGLFLLNNFKGQDIFLDAGSNIGHTALIAASRGGLVYAFEPEEKAFRKLTDNININKLNNVACHQLALSDENGQANLAICANNDGSHSLDKGFQEQIGNTYIKSVMIETRRLDDFKMPQPSIVKIDVEGHEMAVLRGMGHYLPKTRYLIIETLNSRLDELVKYLSSHQFNRFYALNQQHRFVLLDGGQRLTKKRLWDILAVNEEAADPIL